MKRQEVHAHTDKRQEQPVLRSSLPIAAQKTAAAESGIQCYDKLRTCLVLTLLKQAQHQL